MYQVPGTFEYCRLDCTYIPGTYNIRLIVNNMSDIKKEIEIDEQNRENGKHVKGIGEHKSGVR